MKRLAPRSPSFSSVIRRKSLSDGSFPGCECGWNPQASGVAVAGLRGSPPCVVVCGGLYPVFPLIPGSSSAPTLSKAASESLCLFHRLTRVIPSYLEAVILNLFKLNCSFRPLDGFPALSLFSKCQSAYNSLRGYLRKNSVSILFGQRNDSDLGLCTSITRGARDSTLLGGRADKSELHWK